jgi:hypothetical protein
MLNAYPRSLTAGLSPSSRDLADQTWFDLVDPTELRATKTNQPLPGPQSRIRANPPERRKGHADEVHSLPKYNGGTVR